MRVLTWSFNHRLICIFSGFYFTWSIGDYIILNIAKRLNWNHTLQISRVQKYDMLTMHMHEIICSLFFFFFGHHNLDLLISDHQKLHSSKCLPCRLSSVKCQIMLSCHILNACSCPRLTGALYQNSFLWSYFKFVCLRGRVHSLFVLLNCTDVYNIFDHYNCFVLNAGCAFVYVTNLKSGLCLIFSAYCMVSVCSDI